MYLIHIVISCAVNHIEAALMLCCFPAIKAITDVIVTLQKQYHSY